MITQLTIKNYALINSLDITFQEGFSVITGETGAGKSIILGAIGLLLGQRADTKSIRTGERQCVVEAHFDLTSRNLEPFFSENELEYDASDCIIRREITSTGKSRAFINDSPVNLSLMRMLGEQLVDIHSQHQNLLLRDDDFQLSVVDSIVGDNSKLIAYQKVYDELITNEKKLSLLKDNARKGREREDYLRFLVQELHDANLADKEEVETLEEEQKLLSHAEEIKQAFFEISSAFFNEDNGLVYELKRVASKFDSIANVYSRVNEYTERVNSCYVEIKDIAADVESMCDDIDYDPQRMQLVDERLDLLYSLMRKHNCSKLEELIILRDNLSEELESLDCSDEKIKELENLVNDLRGKAQESAAGITKLRKKAGQIIERDMHERLVTLGMPNVQFVTDISSSALSRNGADSVSFLFSANKNVPPQPVEQIASGGEIARVMLSLKAMISKAKSLPTIIFDEIDTGVSGKIAESMANTMSEMCDSGCQVLSITHLPQIAALGKIHYKVEKFDTENITNTSMRCLSDDDRIMEIAQMLSGSTITETAIAQAKQLLS